MGFKKYKSNFKYKYFYMFWLKKKDLVLNKFVSVFGLLNFMVIFVFLI